MAIEWTSLWLTVRLAGITTLVLLIIATPIAWWLANSRRRGVILAEAMIALPLVLPPTVMGFYVLLLFSPKASFGGFWLSLTGNQLAFTFEGLVLASVLYSFPFAVQPLQAAFSGFSGALLEAAATLGASPLDRFIHVILPLSRHGYLTAAVLTFSHTIGEFGVVLMIGGNIPGETRVVSIAIFEAVETLNYDAAHALSLILLLFSFSMLVLIYGFNRRTVMGRRLGYDRSINIAD